MADIRELVNGFYAAWNAHDFQSWFACCNEDVAFSGPGGAQGQGQETARMFWSLWQDAFPDNKVTIKVAVVEGEEAMQEALFSGTHTALLRSPSGDIPATNKSVAVPYMLALTSRSGKWSSFRLYFDQVELMTQLGLMPTPASAS